MNIYSFLSNNDKTHSTESVPMVILDNCCVQIQHNVYVIDFITGACTVLYCTVLGRVVQSAIKLTQG